MIEESNDELSNQLYESMKEIAIEFKCQAFVGLFFLPSGPVTMGVRIVSGDRFDKLDPQSRERAKTVMASEVERSFHQWLVANGEKEVGKG